ncbi:MULTISPECIES: hypothetical protein [Dyella]|uniref:Uncharacterized protein n=2 Tax=Dyella TaxID=231454 RepID=A0A4R0Z0H2_9GAMM|nr:MULTISPECIES: hypothetical protein [Dyella]TBR39559.1 hypothetical protein EYV96_04940 [Dyella terrae]TCI12858.1 hypothetical protein EZM97_05930 [Dyella soli]
MWSDRKQEWAGLILDNGHFDAAPSTDLEARGLWFCHAFGASPTMFRRGAEASSDCGRALPYDKGMCLEAGKTCMLSVPPPAPDKLSWSVIVHDVETRSQVLTIKARRHGARCLN